jgi:hypothetical protein
LFACLFDCVFMTWTCIHPVTVCLEQGSILLLVDNIWHFGVHWAEFKNEDDLTFLGGQKIGSIPILHRTRFEVEAVNGSLDNWTWSGLAGIHSVLLLYYQEFFWCFHLKYFFSFALLNGWPSGRMSALELTPEVLMTRVPMWFQKWFAVVGKRRWCEWEGAMMMHFSCTIVLH